MQQILDLTEKYIGLFTSQSLSALTALKTDQEYIILSNHEILNLTHFVGIVHKEQEYRLAKEIVDAFNDVVSRGMVKGVLSSLSSIDLHPVDMSEKEGLFLFAFIDDPKKYLQEKYSHLIAPEGSAGNLHVY